MTTNNPADGERFMIFEGLVQWTQGIIFQAQRVSASQAAQFHPETKRDAQARRLATLNFHSQCHYFAIAVDMFSEFRKRAGELGLFA